MQELRVYDSVVEIDIRRREGDGDHGIIVVSIFRDEAETKSRIKHKRLPFQANKIAKNFKYRKDNLIAWPKILGTFVVHFKKSVVNF